MHQLRLSCSEFSVDVRLREFNGRWLAVADTPKGPSIGWGKSVFAALWMALQPFDGIIEELLAGLEVRTPTEDIWS